MCLSSLRVTCAGATCAGALSSIGYPQQHRVPSAASGALSSIGCPQQHRVPPSLLSKRHARARPHQRCARLLVTRSRAVRGHSSTSKGRTRPATSPRGAGGEAWAADSVHFASTKQREKQRARPMLHVLRRVALAPPKHSPPAPRCDARKQDGRVYPNRPSKAKRSCSGTGGGRRQRGLAHAGENRFCRSTAPLGSRRNW